DLIGGRVHEPQLDVRRNPLLERRDRLVDAAARVDDVRVLLFLDVEGDRRTAVDPGDRVLLLLPIDDVGDLRQVDGRAALLRDDDPRELRRVLDLAFDANDRIGLAARDAARGNVLIRGANGV